MVVVVMVVVIFFPRKSTTTMESRDKTILEFMFDPFLVEYSFSNPTDDELTITGKPQSETLTDDQRKAKQLELEAIELANQNKINEALSCLDHAVKLFPEDGSLYNNRAQVYRLLNRIPDARKDLDRAIELAGSSPSVMKQAYCQRAQIRLLSEDQVEKAGGLDDMRKAAELGQRFARSYMAKMNPYAALCNQMLNQMFEPYVNSIKCPPKP